jgi:hypothetical protein
VRGRPGWGGLQRRPTLSCRPEQDPRNHADQQQVGEHLDGHPDPGSLRRGHDVAETDGDEDRDREVERVGPGERLVEAGWARPSHRVVRRGEQADEQREADRHRLECAQPWVRRAGDRQDLQPEDQHRKDDAGRQPHAEYVTAAEVEWCQRESPEQHRGADADACDRGDDVPSGGTIHGRH